MWMVVVESKGTFVPVSRKEISRFTVNKRWTPAAGVIAHPPPLHFDDVGAEIAQQHSAVRTGKRFGEFNDTNRIQHGLHA